MKKLLAFALLALAAVSTAYAEVTVLEEDDEPLDIPTDSPYMQTVVASAPDKLYRYSVLVDQPSDREKVKEFVSVVVESRRRLSETNPAEDVETFHHIDRIVAIRCTVSMAASLGDLDYVVSVVMDLGMYANVQYNWGNDRTDQDAFPGSRTYTPLATGKGQRVYILDTGITTNHEEFAYGTRALHGWNFVSGNNDVTDGHSHGTHCAGSAVGASIGMAPDAVAVGVKVLDDNGGGSSYNVIRGMEWATADAIAHGVKGVMSLSLGGPADNSMDNAMTAASAKGMIPVIAAGNSFADACNYSPARSTGGITVGATNKYDELAYFSNKGTCVDIFAPGRSIVSASNQDPNTYRVKSGTSMAAPHVAGAVAVFLELLGGKGDLDTIMDLLEAFGGRNYIITDALDNAPNLILRVPAKGESFNSRATGSPTNIVREPTNKPTKIPTVKPTAAPSKAPTVTSAVLTVDQQSKLFRPSAIGPDFDPQRALNGYLVADESNKNGCAAFTGDLTGHVAFIKRGGCSFYDKILHAQNAGAAGVVVWNSVVGDLVEMGYSTDTSDITITSFFISLEDGTQIESDIAAGHPGHVFVGHPTHYTAPGAPRPDFGATVAPTQHPTKTVTASPTTAPTTSPSVPEPDNSEEPCETYKWYSHCMKITFPPRWTKCNWDHSTSTCKVRTAMPCNQHRLWKTCNIHGDVCQYVNGGCTERPIDKRKPLPPENGPNCLANTDKPSCDAVKASCFWVASPDYQVGCYSRGGGGILEAGGSPDEPYSPSSCQYGTYWQAHNYCQQNDMRLCSAQELQDDRGSTTNLSKQDSDCDVTTRYMWTNARCGVSSVRTYYEASDTTRCQTVPSWRSRAGFRCCQDIPDGPF